MELEWSNDLEIDVKRFPSGDPLLTIVFGLWHGDTLINSLQFNGGSDNWATKQISPGAWGPGTLSKIDGFSMTFGYYPGFGTGPKTAMMDNFRINIGGWQIFYTAGDVGTIQGVVFNDTSGNGIREDEDGLSGTMVYLTGTQEDSVLTDSLGNYKFPDLPHGSYTVTSPVASGWFQTKPTTGSYNVTIGPDTLFFIGDFGNHATTAKAFRVQKGWNIVSVPLDVADYSVSALYPSAITAAYAYIPETGYQQVDSLENGPGFWLKFGYDQFIFMDGADVTSDTVVVAEGWNLVGAITSPTLVEDITSDDPEMILGDFWKYTSSYQTVDTLMANQGYWVKSNKTGSIMMSSNPPAGATAFKVRIIPDGERPPSPPGGDDSPSTLLRVPTEYRLEQNYPNPFNPVTRIKFLVPSSSQVRLTVYDLLGREVALLVNEVRQPGSYEVQFNASHLPSGFYIYRLQAGGHIATNKMILMK